MDKKKRNLWISTILIILAVIFTILAKVVDVNTVEKTGSEIGFSTINQAFFNTIGVNDIWYDITKILGVVAILIAVGYGVVGLIQFIKRKSILKVDKEILLLGSFYVVVMALYAFFEKCIINYRPILTDGALEASYPSSHTLMTVCVCISAIMVNKRLFSKYNITKYMNIACIVMTIVMVVGRLLSGVHWFTDIIGGILISAALLMTFYTLLDYIKKEK